VAHASDEPIEPVIGAQWIQCRIYLEKEEPSIMALHCALQPEECALLFAQACMDQGNLVVAQLVFFNPLLTAP
jgi:hypothetical protein